MTRDYPRAGFETDTAECDVCSWSASGPWSAVAGAAHNEAGGHSWTLTRQGPSVRTAPSVTPLDQAREEMRAAETDWDQSYKAWRLALAALATAEGVCEAADDRYHKATIRLVAEETS